MKENVRPWLVEGGPEGLLELLRSAAVDEPTAEQLLVVQAKLAPLFWAPPVGSGGGGTDGGGAAAGHGGASAVGGAGASAAHAVAGAGLGAGAKVVLGAAVAALVGGAVTFQAGRAFERSRSTQAPRVAAPVLPTAVVPPLVAEPSPSPVAEPEAPAPVKPIARSAPAKVAAPPAPESADEVGALQEAMAALQAGDPTGALAELQRHATAFPHSQLSQERDVLIIECLVALGRAPEARSRADAFRAKWPTSTHLLHIETLLRK